MLITTSKFPALGSKPSSPPSTTNWSSKTGSLLKLGIAAPVPAVKSIWVTNSWASVKIALTWSLYVCFCPDGGCGPE